MGRYTDLAYGQDADGIFDLVIDEAAADFGVTEGLESAILVSLFSDRRADESEVPNPMQRRGWIGNTIASTPTDNHGSGLWLYEQRRMTQEIANAVRMESEQCLQWMVEENLAAWVEAGIGMRPSRRQLDIVVTLHFRNGTNSQRSYVLADATRSGRISTTPQFRPGHDDARDTMVMWGEHTILWDYGAPLQWGS